MTRQGTAHGVALAPLAIGLLLADGAAADARTALPEIHPVDNLPTRSASSSLERGKAELRAGRPADAVASFRAALAGDPQSVDALSGMAIAYDQLGRYDLSRPLYEAALILDPRSPVLLYNYGLSLHLRRDHAGARRFLALAAASGDAEVETAALGLMARLDPQPAETMPQQAKSSPAGMSETARPALADPPAEAAMAPQGPALVRTSAHEVRLLLRPAAAAPAPLVAELGAEALAALPVTGLSAREDARILAQEDAAIASEALAMARAEAAAHEAQALAALPPALHETLAAAKSLQRRRMAPLPAMAVATTATGKPQTASLPPSALEPGLASADAAAASTAAAGLEAEQRLALMLAQPALQPQRRSPLVREATLLPPAEPQPKPRRAFEAPFDSDDARLNGFARRVLAGEPDPALAIGRLQALVDRLQAA